MTRGPRVVELRLDSFVHACTTGRCDILRAIFVLANLPQRRPCLQLRVRSCCCPLLTTALPLWPLPFLSSSFGPTLGLDMSAFVAVVTLHIAFLPLLSVCYASCLILSSRASLMLPTYLICTTGPFLPSTGLTSDFAAI